MSCRLEAAVMETYLSGDKSVLTPDVGGTGNTSTFTEAICEKL
jgi:isocitrate/isopropylmalate dehydrogenase